MAEQQQQQQQQQQHQRIINDDNEDIENRIEGNMNTNTNENEVFYDAADIINDDDGDSEGYVDVNNDDENIHDGDVEDKLLSFGCQHYSRGVELLAPCCNRYFVCRLCHNDTIAAEMEPKLYHELDRHSVKTLRCLRCLTVCSPPTTLCNSCGEIFGAYSCLICNMFDDEGLKKNLYHCDGCGICRVGPRNEFFHCDRCGCCLSNALKGNHTCKDDLLRGSCPVCMEDLFSGRGVSVSLHCGHFMHKYCRTELMKVGYKCPLCNKSIFAPEDMTPLWDHIDREVAANGVPDEYKDTKVNIQCHDCQAKAIVPLNFVALKCTNCNGYNTTRI